MYKVPLTNSPNQTFTSTIPVDGINITFRFKLWYNYQAKYWLLSLSNWRTGEEYFVNLPLLWSRNKFGDILWQLKYKNIGMCFILPVSEDELSAPGEENIGKDYWMIWEDSYVTQ